MPTPSVELDENGVINPKFRIFDCTIERAINMWVGFLTSRNLLWYYFSKKTEKKNPEEGKTQLENFEFRIKVFFYKPLGSIFEVTLGQTLEKIPEGWKNEK